VTRPGDQAHDLRQQLTALGAEVLEQPGVTVSDPPDWENVDAVLGRLGDFDWIVFSSSNGVRSFLDRLRHLGGGLERLAGAKVAAIGPGTAAELARQGLAVDLLPEEFRGESLAAALAAEAPGRRFLLVRANRGRQVLPERLAAAGAVVEQVVVYWTHDVAAADPAVAAALAAGRIDWVTITSSAIARSIVGLLGEDLRKSRLASISPLTSSVLRELGHEPAAEAQAYTMEGLVAAIVAADAGMTPAQLAEARQYGRLEIRCTLADKALDLVFLAIMVLAAPRLDAWLQGSARLDRLWTLRLGVFFLILTALHVLVSLPLSFYSGYRLEHRFHLSTLRLRGWLWRYVKRNLLAAALGLVLAIGLYWLIWTTGPWWWLAAAAAFFLVSVVLGQLAPVLILPLFYKIERLEAPELTGRIARLAEGTGLGIEGVYRMALSEETRKANAMLAGLGRTRRVLLGDTLLEGFTPEEIEVIFAHEIGHHVLRHIRKMIVAGIFFSAAGFWFCDRLLAAWAGGGGADYGQMPISTLPLVLLALTLFATLLEPLSNAISRRFERQADGYALGRTGRPAAYISAFRKLAQLNKDDPCPPRLRVLLFYSHPPIAERLAMAERRDWGSWI
jgi:STE24 endopeptidase